MIASTSSWGPVGGAFGEQLGEGAGLFRQASHVFVAAEQVGAVGAEHGRARGFQPDDGDAVPEVVSQHVERAPEHSLGGGQLPGRDPREPAAERFGGYPHLEAGILEHEHRGPSHVGVKVVAEGVWPQQHEASRRKGGDGAFGRNAARLLQQRRQRALGQSVDQGRRETGALRQQRKPAHRVVRHRAEPPGVVVGEELGLVGGHVDADGAVALAPLARQAQVESIAHLGGAPAAGDGLTAQHLEEQPGPAPC